MPRRRPCSPRWPFWCWSPAQPQLVINEFMQNPSAVSDANGDWFELYNPTTNSVEINGWTVRDDDTASFVVVHGGENWGLIG